jgi:predicted PurR-regulated permease PerM
MSKKGEQLTTKILYVVFFMLIFALVVSPFFIPILLAGSISLALFPLLLRLERFGLPRKRAAALLTVVFTILVSIPVLFFLIKGAGVVTDQLESIQHNEQYQDQGVKEIVKDIRGDVVDLVHRYAVRFHQEDFLTRGKINKILDSVITFLIEFFRGFAGNAPLFFLFLLITVLCTYSFLKNATNVRNFFQEVFGFTDERMNELVSIFISDARQVYVTNITTGTIQAAMVATSSAVLHIASWFVIFFITLILSFIPVIGAAPVAFISAAIAYLFQENGTAAIIMVVVGLLTGGIDNVLRPWLASLGESRVPPIVAFISVLGGAILLGFPGLFLGLLMGSLIFDTMPLFWKEIAKSNEARWQK